MATEEHRDTLPSVEDIALGLTYIDGDRINPITVGMRYQRATDLHDAMQQVIDEFWLIVDMAKNRP